MDVPKKIMEHVYRYDISYTRLATVANVSSAAITKWLKGDYQLSFPNILALVKHLFPDEELELMGEYSLTLKNQNARLALEYCSINYLPQYDQLLNSLFEGNREDVEWASIYSLTKIEDPQVKLQKLRDYKTNISELKVYILLQEIYAHYTARKFHLIEDLSERVDFYHRQIKVDFIREMYSQRSYQMKVYYKLYQAQVEECREYSKKMIEVAASKFLVATGYQTLGETFLFEDYDQAKQYFEMAHTKYIEINSNARWALRSLNFLNFVWEKEPEYLDHQSSNYHDIESITYYHIIRKEMDLAVEQLSRVDFNQLNEQQKAYYLYDLYKIYNKEDYLYDSISHFIKAGDKFYRRIAIRELYKLQLNGKLITSLTL